ncbi:ribonuclease HII [Rhizobiales bacterium]|uniref:ribonuclease HII n=1 Tax=Hongsoonwoonella zoysiae TaxID=2821844 RepID=UPI001561983F|nr:ribonuclease HII [Hongsoonwoonella zoysiae]NRG19760.1 ribonuclease HII [Hongsoonwoonella zoysiae]
MLDFALVAPLSLDLPEALSPEWEAEIAARFANRLAGIDEAGRGPWAGPVVTAAVILDYTRLPEGLDDSKKLTEARREALFEEICATADVSIAYASPSRIDAMNIRAATLWAMTRAAAGLQRAPQACLIDGKDTPPALTAPSQAVIKGDGRLLAVAAASIVAKVARDRLMVRLDALAPGYGFAAHKGYGTAEHAAALSRLGPCAHHRKSFRPVRETLEATD